MAAGSRGLDPADLDPRDGIGALGFLNAMRDLKEVTTKGACAMTSPFPRATIALALAFAAALPATARELRVCADPTSCRSRTTPARDSRTASSPATSAPR